MSIGSLGAIINSAIGAPLAQSKGTEVDRINQDSSNQERHASVERKAEAAAGVGETDGENHESAERDADGRRLWERMGGKASDNAEESAADTSPRLVRDPSGESGNLLDLSG